MEPFFEDNIDVALINVGHSALDYKLVVVPADYVMDAASAEAIRNYVRNGGTAIMTAMSAKVDENEPVVRYASSRKVERPIWDSHVRVLSAKRSTRDQPEWQDGKGHHWLL